MPNGKVRRSHLANFFQVTGKLNEEINQRPKRFWEENNPLSEIFVETPSTVILVEESNTLNPKFLSPETHNQKSSIKEKQVRLESNKEFLLCCITDVLVSKGLELMLNQTISYIEQTIKTLKNTGEQLKIRLDTSLIQ